MTSRSLLAAVALLLAGISVGQDKQDRLDERVQVELKNGSTIVGLLRGGRVYERLGRHGYEETDEVNGRKSGVRVWYFKNQEGFIFLPVRSIHRLSRAGELTRAESRELREAVARATAEREAASATAPSDPTSTGLSDDEQALLREFPPESWSSDRLGDIQRKRIVLRQEPSAAESRFVERFDAWDAARRKLGPVEDPATPPTPKPVVVN